MKSGGIYGVESYSGCCITFLGLLECGTARPEVPIHATSRKDQQSMVDYWLHDWYW